MIISRKNAYLLLGISFSILALIGFYLSFLETSEKLIGEKQGFEDLGAVKYQMSQSFKEPYEDWPEKFNINEDFLEPEYTLDHDLTIHIKGLLKKYRTDFSSVVVLDNSTGEILAAVGHKREGDRFIKNLPFSATHPSASLIKIVTTASLLASGNVQPETTFEYRGRGTTLYKYQLTDRTDKWTREQSLEKAFAFSNNVIFAKAAQRNIEKGDLLKSALAFGFNQDLMEDLDLANSTFLAPTSEYNLAELASGFNDQTHMSTVHGALLSLVVANEGMMVRPSIIKTLVDTKTREKVWQHDPIEERSLSENVAVDLKNMMVSTVRFGTARGSFRRMNRNLKESLIVGGKTGSITGGIPFGKRDWFTGFARLKGATEKRGISVCVMNINKKKWYVKSSELAKLIIEHYFIEQEKIKKRPLLTRS